MAEPARRAAVVVVSYGPAEVLAGHALSEEAVASALDAGAAVVVVDNYSTPQARHDVRELCRQRGVELVERPDNAGFGAAANAGAERAWALGCTSVVLLNPDAVIDSDVLRELAAHAEAAPDAVVAPVVVRPDGSTWAAGGQLRLADGRLRPVPASGASRLGSTDLLLEVPGWTPWVTGACLAASRERWASLGGFDTGYFLYWEDVDLSWRCTRAGGRLLVRHDLRVLHSVGGTQAGAGRGRGAKSATYLLCNTRNRLWFARRNLSRRDVARWTLSAPAAALEVARRGGPRSWPWKLHDVAWVVRGTLEGLLTAPAGRVAPSSPPLVNAAGGVS